MEKIISYSFFEPKKIHKHRFWDKFNNVNRYWYNIPSMVLLNRLIYPDFDIVIHISSNIKEKPLYSLLLKLQENDLISLVEIKSDYTDTEPTLWRYKPLLNKECDILLCRDIDSLPTVDEVRSTKYFIESDYKVTTIRSHTNHTSPGTIMLAGLCGFRTKHLNLDLDFNDMLKMRGSWGLDQGFLIGSITKDQDWTSVNFLDSRLSSKEHTVGKPLIKCISFDESYYRDNVNLDINDEILEFLNDCTSWAGEPIDSRKGKLDKLLNISDDFKYMRNIIESDETIKKFYL